MMIDPDLDYQQYFDAVDFVEENNKLNGGSWDEWEDAKHVELHFNIELCECGKWLINRAIFTNGATVDDDLLAVEKAIFGQNLPH